MNLAVYMQSEGKTQDTMVSALQLVRTIAQEFHHAAGCILRGLFDRDTQSVGGNLQVRTRTKYIYIYIESRNQVKKKKKYEEKWTTPPSCVYLGITTYQNRSLNQAYTHIQIQYYSILFIYRYFLSGKKINEIYIINDVADRMQRISCCWRPLFDYKLWEHQHLFKHFKILLSQRIKWTENIFKIRESIKIVTVVATLLQWLFFFFRSSSWTLNFFFSFSWSSRDQRVKSNTTVK